MLQRKQEESADVGNAKPAGGKFRGLPKQGRDEDERGPPNGSWQEIQTIERTQVLLRPLDVEKLVEEDHPVRGIWAMVSPLDLKRLEQTIKAVEGRPGKTVSIHGC